MWLSCKNENVNLLTVITDDLFKICKGFNTTNTSGEFKTDKITFEGEVHLIRRSWQLRLCFGGFVQLIDLPFLRMLKVKLSIVFNSKSSD